MWLYDAVVGQQVRLDGVDAMRHGVTHEAHVLDTRLGAGIEGAVQNFSVHFRAKRLRFAAVQFARGLPGQDSATAGRSAKVVLRETV